MQIEVSNRSPEVDRSIQVQIRSIIEDTLSRFSGEVTRIEAHIADVNGPKCGLDKACTLEGRIAGKEPVCASAKAETIAQAVQQAAGKLNRILTDATEKRADKRRGLS